MAEKYDKHIKEILSAVGDKADRKEVERDFKNYVEEFRLSPTEAKKMIARKYGAPSVSYAEPTKKAIGELGPLDRSVSMLCRVVFVAEKKVKGDAGEKVVLSGILGDDTGTAPFTLWEKGELTLQKGDVVKIENAYVTEWKEKVQINIGNRGTLVKADSSEMPKFSGAISRPQASLSKISSLGDASSNVSVLGRVLSADAREVTVAGETKPVTSGTIADETGKVGFTCWGKAGFKEGDVVRVGNGYIRKWKGMPQLNFDVSAVEKSKEKMPSEEELARPVEVSVEDLVKRGGMVDASVSGVILDVREGSGLVFRCPECNRVLQKSQCRVHGEVKGNPDLRTKAVLDDGTGALSVIMNREISERLLGKSLDKCMKEAKKAMDQGVIEEELFGLLVAKPVRVIGNVTSDDFGLMLIANDTEFMKMETQSAAKGLLEELL